MESQFEISISPRHIMNNRRYNSPNILLNNYTEKKTNNIINNEKEYYHRSIDSPFLYEEEHNINFYNTHGIPSLIKKFFEIDKDTLKYFQHMMTVCKNLQVIN